MEREMWLIIFNDGSGEFVTLNEDSIEEEFGVNDDEELYTVQKGIWTPTEEQ